MHSVIPNTAVEAHGLRWSADLCHCCVSSGYSGHILQLKSCFLRSEKTTKHSANKKSHCLGSWRTGRCSSLCLLRASRLELALQKLPSVLWPCDGAPARIFSFTGRLYFSLFCLGGSCWNTAGMVASQIFQEPSSLSHSLRLMGISIPVKTALVDFAGENNCFACHFFLHPSQEKAYESCLEKTLLSVFLTKFPHPWEEQSFTAAVLWQQGKNY